MQENDELSVLYMSSKNPSKGICDDVCPSIVDVPADEEHRTPTNLPNLSNQQQVVSVDMPGLTASSQTGDTSGVSANKDHSEVKVHIVHKAREAKLKRQLEEATPLIEDSVQQEFAVKSSASSVHLVSPSFIKKGKIVPNTARVVVSESSDISVRLVSGTHAASDSLQMQNGDTVNSGPVMGNSLTPIQLAVPSPEANLESNQTSEMKGQIDVCDQGTASEVGFNIQRALKRENTQKNDQDVVGESDLQVTFERKTVITDGRSLQRASTSITICEEQNHLNSLNSEIGPKATATPEPSTHNEDGRETRSDSADLEEGAVEDGDNNDNYSDSANVSVGDAVDGNLVGVGADGDRSEVVNCDIVAGPPGAAHQWNGNRLTVASRLLEAAVVTPELVRTYETLVGTSTFSENQPRKIVETVTTQALVNPDTTMKDSESSLKVIEGSDRAKSCAVSTDRTLELTEPSIVETEPVTNKNLALSVATSNALGTKLKSGADVTLEPVPLKSKRGRPRKSKTLETPHSEKLSHKIIDLLDEVKEEVKPTGSKNRSHLQKSPSSEVMEEEKVETVRNRRKSSRKKSPSPAISEVEMKPVGSKRKGSRKRSPLQAPTQKTRKRPWILESDGDSGGESTKKLQNRSTVKTTNITVKTEKDPEVGVKLGSEFENVKSELPKKRRSGRNPKMKDFGSDADVKKQKSEASGSQISESMPAGQDTEANNNYSNQEEGLKSTKAPKRRRRAEKSTSRQKPSPTLGECGKCGYAVTTDLWDRHNAMNHAGLGWLAGKPPIDQRTADSQQLLVLVRTAFKICKEATCSLCGVSKRSFLGFHAHILVSSLSSLNCVN